MTRELDALEYEVSIFGGYEDENSTSEDITETMLSVMQVSVAVSTRHDMLLIVTMFQALNARFRLLVACTGPVNTVTKAGVAWPRVYGAAVR